MYLLFFEDFSVIRVDTISDDDKDMSDDGYSIIIDIDNPKNPMKYGDGKWEAL